MNHVHQDENSSTIKAAKKAQIYRKHLQDVSIPKTPSHSKLYEKIPQSQRQNTYETRLHTLKWKHKLCE